MITSKTTQNYLADCVSKHIPPELQSAARQAIADKQVTPLVIEAVAKQLEESAMAASKAGAVWNTQSLAELSSVVRAMEKRLGEKDSGDTAKEKTLASITDVASQVDDVRNTMRTLEDKVDTLVPYQIWKVMVFAGLACVIGAVVSWNIRPVYKQWQWEQQQQEGR